MSVAETRTTLDEYMHALLTGGDFGSFFSDDVVWTTMETGEEIRGRGPVRDFIVALHTQLFHATPEVRGLAVGDGVAGLGAGFLREPGAGGAGIPPQGGRGGAPHPRLSHV